MTAVDRPQEYRPDIDGLRAVAVLSVFAFHLNFSGVSGGFVGVDVFFVISGYLITNLIRKEIAARGSFRLSRFYLRRARRLLPALYVTLLGSSIAAAFAVKGELLGRFAGSLFSSAVSFSNVYFWRESGYFDALSTQKPLLHTWSLGVEEQFYLFWPIFMIAVMAKRRGFIAPLVIALAALASLAANMFIVNGELTDPADGRGFSTIFYLTPFRVFEFAIGALVLWAPSAEGRWAFLRDAAVAIGLVWLAYAFATYSETMIFPSVNALGPAIASALVIWGGAGTLGRAALANPPAVYIGKISYSLYLLHWPLIVFYKILSSGEGAEPELGPVAQILLLAIGVAGAAAMYRYVETPFRNPDKGPGALSAPAFGLACALIAFVFVVPSAFLWQGGGYFGSRTEERAGEELVAATASEPETPTATTDAPSIAAAPVTPYGVAPPSIADLRRTFDPDVERKYTWQLLNALDKPFAGDGRKVLLIGDSQGADFLNILQHHPKFNDVEVTTFISFKQCQIAFSKRFFSSGDWTGGAEAPRGMLEKCKLRVAQLQNDQRIGQADAVVLAFSWHDIAPKYLAAEIAGYKGMGASNIFVVGRKHQYTATLNARGDTVDEIQKYLFEKLNPASGKRNRELEAAANGAKFIDLLSIICRNGRCMHFTKENYPVFYDSGHVTASGAAYIGRNLDVLALGDLILDEE